MELTEHALADAEGTAEAITRIREAGVRIEVGDFGAGSASPGLLRSLPLDGIKIGRVLMADIATSPAALAIVRSIVYLAEDL